ncbi:transmembrane protein, putative [Medicago truncatula]|uniref:Transmembrane protein, putative n=1 Tax=Medicago truncatula TaxID=3880 RepID=A0A072W0N1_MEDTR|nr:transmembrane protein, putative [Medicago truncatula]
MLLKKQHFITTWACLNLGHSFGFCFIYSPGIIYFSVNSDATISTNDCLQRSQRNVCIMPNKVTE